MKLLYYRSIISTTTWISRKKKATKVPGIPVLSEYAKSLESRVKERYSQKISVIGVDPAGITAEQFSPECLRVPNRFGGMRDLAFFRRDIRDLS